MSIRARSRQEQNLALSQFSERVRNHVWSFQTGSFYDLDMTVKKERDFYQEAVRLGIDGVLLFVQTQMDAIEEYMRPSVEAAHNHAEVVFKNRIEYLEKALEETRQKYMKPIDFFMERLKRYDFWWEYSDDGGVARRGQKALDEIKAEIKQGGPEFQKAWDDYCNEQHEASRRAIEADRQRKEEKYNTPPTPLTVFSTEEEKTRMRAYLDNFPTPKATCDNWRLISDRGDIARNDDIPLDCNVIYGADDSGISTKIIGYSANTRRILTRSGSVYQLGRPSAEFANRCPAMVRVFGYENRW